VSRLGIFGFWGEGSCSNKAWPEAKIGWYTPLIPALEEAGAGTGAEEQGRGGAGAGVQGQR
jgi:catalase (peroxidase I)